MSETQFRTLKYRPPRRFENYDHAQRWCQDCVTWYNTNYHHSNLAGFTLQQVFNGDCRCLASERQRTMDHAYAKHPERFSKGRPQISLPPDVVYINPICEGDSNDHPESGVNFSTLPWARKM